MNKKIICLLLLFITINLFQIAYSQDKKAIYSKEIGLPINQPGQSEYAPCISHDGKHMIYVVEKEGKAAFYETSLDDNNQWTTPVSIDTINNYGSPNAKIANPFYNYDATVIYFNANFNNDSSGFDIYYSEKRNETWGPPVNIGSPINTKGYEGQPSITSDDRMLYFVRQIANPEKEDLVCYKMYCAFKNDNGEWGDIEWLPVPLNLDCEKAPRICADNQTFYMSSNREGCKGEFDLYYAKRETRSVWITPISMDTLNTMHTDCFASTNIAGDTMWYSITQKQKKVNVSGIYRMEIPKQFRPSKVAQLNGIITDRQTKKPVQARIVITDPYTSRLIADLKNYGYNGKYNIILTQGREYRIDVFAPNYSHFYFNHSTKNLTDNTVDQQNISLFSNVALRFNVFDKENFQPQAVALKIKDASTGKDLNIKIENLSAGRFNINLPIGKKYKIEAKKAFYESYTMIFDLSGIVQFDEFERDIELAPIKRKVEIKVKDQVTQQGLPVEIKLTNTSTNEKLSATVVADKDGKYILELREGDKYEVNVAPKGYSFYNTTIDLNVDTVVQNIDIQLTQLKESVKFTLNDINFEFNSADLKSGSFVELDRLVELMKLNPDMKIEVSAHTDDIGLDAYNLKLSDRRAQSVVNYLIDKGVIINNLIAKGYGKTKPVVPNTNEENRAKNRRVEMKILEIKQQ